MKLEDARNVLPPKIYEELEKEVKARKLKGKKLERVVEAVVNEYLRSKMTPGECVGIVAAQSISEPATQLTMRTKHLAGVAEKNVTVGFPRLIEIVNARTRPSTPMMTIYLKDKKDRNKAYEFAKKIQEIKIENITDEINIDVFNGCIIFVLDEKQMKVNDVSIDDIEKALKKIKGIKYEIKGREIYIYPKKQGIKELYNMKVKIKGLTIKGVKGISQVYVDLDDEGNVVITTAGSNLLEILKMPEVDPQRTTTNDIFEIWRVLGIEAARNAIIEEITKILKEQGIDVNIRHIMLLADVMTVDGVIQGATRYGVPAQKASVLSRVGFEVPVNFLVTAAKKGEEERFKGVIENVMVNHIVPIGTGLPKLIYGVVEYEGTERSDEGE